MLFRSIAILSVLAKEIQLQHKAPVLDIQVLDAKGSVLTLEDNEVTFYFQRIHSLFGN